jgi:sugar/nucleoside kinase (ribokinase family)
MVHGDGERTFLHCLGANAELTLDDIDERSALDCKVLLMAGAFLVPRLDGRPIASLLEKAQRSGVITCLDTAWDATGKWMDILAPCMPFIDYFVPSYHEAVKLLPGIEDPMALAAMFREMGAGCVVIKHGEHGCWITEDSGTCTVVPPFDVNTVDALGAGDAWVSGFLAAMLNGLPLKECARFANAVGACCVTSLGATTGIRSYQETMEFMTRTNQKARINAC